MSSGFKNFFITFMVCLVVFAFVGWKFVYPLLTKAGDFTSMGETSDESGEITEAESEPEESIDPIIDNPDYDENGDIFTAVVMAADDSGRAVAAVFLDSNGKTSQFIYSPMNVTGTRITNSVGELVPVCDLFAMLSNMEVCSSMTAFTGMKVDYCVRFDKKSLYTVVSLIPGANVVLSEDIQIVNPKYEDLVVLDGEAYPDDYYVIITNVDGRVLLNEKTAGKTNLEWLLTYNPNPDGSEYNAMYIQICRSLIRQFFENESAMKSSSVLAKLLSAADTNLTTDKASGHLDTIFSYNDFRRHEMSCPYKWEEAQKLLRERDGRTDFSK